MLFNRDLFKINSEDLKALYRQHCEYESTVPLFSQAWWLDATCGESRWGVCVVLHKKEILASMPYYSRKIGGFKTLLQPPLTQSLGPWISQSEGKYSKQLSREKELMQQLISQLPKYDYFKQNWHYSKLNWLPFYWNGFSQTTRYTYVIEDLNDIETVFRNFSSSYRNKIRKAEKLVSVKRNMKPRQFFEINSKTFERQGMAVPYTFELFERQDKALLDRNSREIFYAVDANGAVHSALYLAWDKMSSYVHLVGEDPDLRKSGAGIKLIWEAIKYTSEELKLNIFDFEGSMIEGVEQVRRDCGAKQKAYFSLERIPSRFVRLVRFLNENLKIIP